VADIADLLADGSWADPLTRKERRKLADLLATTSREFWEAAAHRPARARTHSPNEYGDLVGALVRASKEMGDLHLDVTERAKVATS
jgi:hypothetical protein